MNDQQRAFWLDGDDGFEQWWLASGLPKAAFVRVHRARLSQLIQDTITGKRQPHAPVVPEQDSALKTVC